MEIFFYILTFGEKQNFCAFIAGHNLVDSGEAFGICLQSTSLPHYNGWVDQVMDEPLISRKSIFSLQVHHNECITAIHLNNHTNEELKKKNSQFVNNDSNLLVQILNKL